MIKSRALGLYRSLRALRWQILAPMAVLLANLLRDYLVLGQDVAAEFFIFLSTLNLVSLLPASYLVMKHFSEIQSNLEYLYVWLGVMCLGALAYFVIGVPVGAVYYLLVLMLSFSYGVVSHLLISCGYYLYARFHHFLHVGFFLLVYWFRPDLSVFSLYLIALAAGFVVYLASLIWLLRERWQNLQRSGQGQGTANAFRSFMETALVSASAPGLNNFAQVAYFSAGVFDGLVIRIAFYLSSLLNIPIGYLVYKKTSAGISSRLLASLFFALLVGGLVAAWLQIYPLIFALLIVALTYCGRFYIQSRSARSGAASDHETSRPENKENR